MFSAQVIEAAWLFMGVWCRLFSSLEAAAQAVRLGVSKNNQIACMSKLLFQNVPLFCGPVPSSQIFFTHPTYTQMHETMVDGSISCWIKRESIMLLAQLGFGADHSQFWLLAVLHTQEYTHIYMQKQHTPNWIMPVIRSFVFV